MKYLDHGILGVYCIPKMHAQIKVNTNGRIKDKEMAV